MKRSMAERLVNLSIPEPNSGCTLWLGSLDRDGYGQVALGPRGASPAMAHRAAYETFVGPIPQGLEIDHTCTNRACINPFHLEPVTHLENVHRGRLVQETCGRGHLFDEANTYSRTNASGRIGRRCRTCFRMSQSRSAARRRAAA